MKISIEKIGPDEAKALLAGNRNRRIQTPQVAKLARDMRAGSWRPNSIIQVASTSDGEILIDGQHRLAAVAESGVTVEFVFIRGLALDDQQVIDTGRSRSLGDTLTMRGETNASTLASALAWYWRRQRKLYLSNYAPTIAEGLVLLGEHPGLRLSAAPTRRPARSLRIPGGLACCLHYEMSRIESDSADDFWRKVDSGLDLHERHPVYLLRSRLEDNAISRVTRLDVTMIHALITKAWNIYLRGDEIGQLRWTRGGAKPEPFPEMEGPEQW